MNLQLFGHPFSSYTQKALIALYENGTPFEFRMLSPDEPANGAALIARERSHAAADAAALAAAQELAMPSGSLPQLEAADYADRNGASLVSCVCEMGGREALVRVSVTIDHLFLFPGTHAIESDSRAVVDIPVGDP